MNGPVQEYRAMQHQGVSIQEKTRPSTPNQATDEITLVAEMTKELSEEEVSSLPDRDTGNSEDYFYDRTIKKSGTDRTRLFEKMKEEIDRLRDQGYR